MWINDLENEIWKPIVYKGVDYSGRYEVSNLGRIRSLYYHPPLIRTNVLSAQGYYECHLPKGNSRYFYTTVHRVEMETFCPVEGMEHLEVNHKDECKTNNRLDNLEWCTGKENCNYGTRSARISKLKSEPVLCIETRKVFQNQEEATVYANTTVDIMSVHLNRKQRHIHNKHYVRVSKYFAKDHALTDSDIDYIIAAELPIINNTPKRMRGKIKCVETGIIYESQMEAARRTGILQPIISEALRGLTRKAGGYTWIRM